MQNYSNSIENKPAVHDPREQATHDEAQRIRSKGRKSLDRYLEGWTVREVLGANGTVRHERIYIGDYYKSDETKTARILRKTVYFLLFAASAALFVLSAVQQTGANVTGYVAFAQGVVLLVLIWVLSGMFSYLTAPAEMTVADYKSGSLSIKKSSLCMALSFVLPALTTLIHLLTDSADYGRELLCILGYLAAGILILLVYFAEKNLSYTRYPSPEQKWADTHVMEA